MPSDNVAKPNLDDMQIAKRELPAAPVPIRPDPRPEPAPALAPPSYIPVAQNREPAVAWSCRMPLRLRDRLQEVSQEYGTDMTSIVLDLLELHLPKIPKKK